MLRVVPDAPDRIVEIAWRPPVVDETAKLRLRLVAVTEQRDTAMREVALLTATNQAAWDRTRALEAELERRHTRLAARPKAGALVALWGLVTLAWFDLWQLGETPQSRATAGGD